MRMYHGTNTRFARFSLDFAARPGMSGNGHLGVWLAVKPDLANAFGGVCLEVDADISKVYAMPLSELAAMNATCMRKQLDIEDPEALAAYEREFYINQRRALLEQGYDFINLVESDGRVEMGIGLIPERLVIL